MMIPTQLVAGTSHLHTRQSVPPVINSFWQKGHVQEHLQNLRETVKLVKAIQKELEELLLVRQCSANNVEGGDMTSNTILAENFLPSSNNSVLAHVFQYNANDTPLQISEVVREKKINLNVQEFLSLEAANSLISALKSQVAPFSVITSETSSWEERSMAVRLSQKLQKSIRNKRWKKRKRKHAAELLRKELEDYDKADRDADEWRAREIAKDIAKRKVEGMKAIAKLKANEERKRLESELELVLVVEKLQELRSIRIQKLKKQGHFLPEEDDKFLERVRAAVEEEERQAAAAADKDAAKDAIATAEVSRKAIDTTSTAANEIDHNKSEAAVNQEQPNKIESERSLGTDTNQELEQQKNEGQGCSGGYDSVANLPPEFYHYYHGSSNDMGTLIEVRRMWDSYIRPGGSRIPGHWVQPPPPSDEVWASYLVGPK